MKRLLFVLLNVLILLSLAGCKETKEKTNEDIHKLLMDNGWVTIISMGSLDSSYDLEGNCVNNSGEASLCTNVSSNGVYERSIILYWNDESDSIVAKTDEEGLVYEVVYYSANGFYVFDGEQEVVILIEPDNCRYYISGEDNYSDQYENCSKKSIKQADQVVKQLIESLDSVDISVEKIVDYLGWVNDEFILTSAFE